MLKLKNYAEEITLMKNRFKEVSYYLIPIILIIIGFMSVSGSSVWSDEVFSLELIKHPFFELIELDAQDVHPPLYYLILRGFVLVLGKYVNLVALGKCVSIIPYIILVVIGFTYIRKKYGVTTSFLFNLLILGMPKMLSYSIELRMYSWGMLFVTCAFFQLPEILSDNNEKNVIYNYFLLSVFSALASYTHYFACVSCIVIYIELFIVFVIKGKYNNLLGVILSGIGVIVMYLPWLFIFLNQLSVVKEDYWIDALNMSKVLEIVLFLFEHDFIPVGVILLIFIISCISSIALFAKYKDYTAICGIGVWAGTFLLGIILSYAIRPIFVARYLMCSAACLWFAVAIGISGIEIKWIKNYLIIPLVIIIALLIDVKMYRYETWKSKVSIETIAEVDKLITDDTIIASDSDHIQRTMAYLYPKNIVLRIDELEDKGNARVIFIDEADAEYKGLDEGYKVTDLGGFYYDYYSFNIYLIE